MKDSELQTLQETLTSKDFEISLSSRLLACILSPNITAYVTDTQQHIMDFIAENQDVFKIQSMVFNDSELRSTLGKVVTRLLSDICSRLKANRSSQLTASVKKKTCIIDVAKAAARSSSGMEVNATHWMRLAFPRFCLCLFLIGTSDHKVASLKECFTPHLIPFLKTDMCAKIEQDLGVDLKALEKEFHNSSQSDSTDSDNTTVTADTAANNGNGTNKSTNFDWDTLNDEGGDGDTEVDDGDADNDDADDLDTSDSGFGLNGKPVCFNSSKFWNYIDYMLNLIRQAMRKTTTMKELYEMELQKYMVEIFQDDLAECPGLR
ncbi:hypothetical protein V8E55_006857 [Tylopilus felleus]